MAITTSKDYEKDFYLWTSYHAELLRNKKFDEIDIEHIAEEIESMGKSARRELINRVAIVLAHLLKWQFQSERRSNSWKNTIEEQRDEINELINEKIVRAYKRAILIASTETGMAKEAFPEICPFTLDDSLSFDFLPL